MDTNVNASGRPRAITVLAVLYFIFALNSLKWIFIVVTGFIVVANPTKILIVELLQLIFDIILGVSLFKRKQVAYKAVVYYESVRALYVLASVVIGWNYIPTLSGTVLLASVLSWVVQIGARPAIFCFLMKKYRPVFVN